MNFFITGLPRSRTAWLANFFTLGPVYCHHDASRSGPAPKSLRHLAEQTREETGAPLVGDSDSGLLLTARKVQEEFPDAPWLCIRRDAFQAVHSYANYFEKHPYPGVGPLNGWQMQAIFDIGCQRINMLPKIIPEKKLLMVDFPDLDNEAAMRRIWEHLIPEMPFPRLRWKMLNGFNISIISEKLGPVPDQRAEWEAAV